MRLIDVVFNSKKSNEKIDYSNRLKETLDNLSTKPLIVRAFAIPAAVILIFNVLFVVKVLPEDLIPIAQSILDALVSLVGFTFILANAKQKQNASN